MSAISETTSQLHEFNRTLINIHRYNFNKDFPQNRKNLREGWKNLCSDINTKPCELTYSHRTIRDLFYCINSTGNKWSTCLPVSPVEQVRSWFPTLQAQERFVNIQQTEQIIKNHKTKHKIKLKATIFVIT